MLRQRFISRDLDLWAYSRHVTLDFSRPGKPTDIGFIEAFNSKLRSECLNAHWFTKRSHRGWMKVQWQVTAASVLIVGNQHRY